MRQAGHITGRPPARALGHDDRERVEREGACEHTPAVQVQHDAAPAGAQMEAGGGERNFALTGCGNPALARPPPLAFVSKVPAPPPPPPPPRE